jgi:hydrogenase 3 maturation protease
LNKTTVCLEEELRAWLKGAEHIVIAGIGNTIRCDDGVGVRIVEGLHCKVSLSVTLIECETAPESFVDEIVALKPTHVLLIDAAKLGMKPGKVRLCSPEEVLNMRAISTHALPIRVFCEYVVELTGAKIALILIEPKWTEFGEGLTEDIESTAAIVESALCRLVGTSGEQ